jgi:quercetin 2,3-dioxygenase
MIRYIPASKRHFSDIGWLKTYWLFSFDNYHDPENMHWGVLRVFNDDHIEAGQGFSTHPHRDMEIVTIVHKGELTHEDSMGNKGVIRPGDVQRMSAGSGILHSEFNYGREPVELYQIWILPREHGIKPTYAQQNFGKLKPNVLIPVCTGSVPNGAITMHADAIIYLAELEAGKTLEYSLPAGRCAFLYVTEGQLTVNGTTLERRDQARIKDEAKLVITAGAETRFILVDASLT